MATLKLATNASDLNLGTENTKKNASLDTRVNSSVSGRNRQRDSRQKRLFEVPTICKTKSLDFLQNLKITHFVG